MRLAYFSPLPPAKTGIADYAAELLPALGERCELALFCDAPAAVDPVLRDRFPVYPVSSYPERHWAFDLPLYHIGNNPLHRQIYLMALRYGGVCVLHDWHLYDTIAYFAATEKRFVELHRELAYAEGAAGSALARAIKAGQAEHPIARQPLNRRLIDSSLGILVHSRFAAREILARSPAARVTTLPLVMPTPSGRSQSDLRRTRNIPPDAPLLGLAGFLNPPKQPERVLAAFRQLRRSRPHAHLVILGEALPPLDLDALIGSDGTHIHPLGHIPDLATFESWLATLDFLISLRAPTKGETSSIVLRGMALGCPSIVYDHGWYSELPDDVCLKVAVKDDAALLAAMQRLASDQEACQRLGQTGQAYIAAHHAPQQVATQLIHSLNTWRTPEAK